MIASLTIAPRPQRKTYYEGEFEFFGDEYDIISNDGISRDEFKDKYYLEALFTSLGVPLSADVGTYSIELAQPISITDKSTGEDVTDEFDVVLSSITHFSVVPRSIEISAKSASKGYDKMPLVENDFTVSGMVNGDNHQFNVAMASSSTITKPGTCENVIASIDGVDVQAGVATDVGNYKITTYNGILEVTSSDIEVEPDPEPDPEPKPNPNVDNNDDSRIQNAAAAAAVGAYLSNCRMQAMQYAWMRQSNLRRR